MPGSIETITDKTKFDSILYENFVNKEVYIKTKTMNMRISFMGYTEGECALRIPLIKFMPPSCIVFARNASNTIYGHMTFVRKEEEEIYIFRIEKIQIISSNRSEERKPISDQGKIVIFITRIISDFIIEKSLATEMRKVNQIKLTLVSEIEKHFHYKKIYFRNEGMSDTRMRYFYERNPGFVISDINKVTDDPVFKNYMEEIYGKDYFLINRKIYVSEMSIPINYKGVIPIGYIQVNNTAPLKESAFDVMNRLSRAAEQMIMKLISVPSMDERLLISDVSAKGLGIVFKDRKYLRYFQEKSYFYFDMMLPDNLRIPMLAVVRSISLLENKIIKIGCEIVHIDSAAKPIYDHFLNNDLK